MKEVLGRYVDSGMNFVEGEPLNERNRVEVFIDDQGLYREFQVESRCRDESVGTLAWDWCALAHEAYEVVGRSTRQFSLTL